VTSVLARKLRGGFGLVVAGAAVVICGAPAMSRAQDRGVQVSPDDDLILVSKDLAGQRWAIALNPATGIATGNTFPIGGGPPSFVWCRTKTATLNSDPRTNQYVLDCFGASACPQLPCPKDEWSFISEVTIDGAFFLPPP